MSLRAAEGISGFTFDLASVITQNAPLSRYGSVFAPDRRRQPQRSRGCEKARALRRVVYDIEDCREGLRVFKERRNPTFLADDMGLDVRLNEFHGNHAIKSQKAHH